MTYLSQEKNLAPANKRKQLEQENIVYISKR